jgi:hypothetical protein
LKRRDNFINMDGYHYTGKAKSHLETPHYIINRYSLHPAFLSR